MGLYQSFTVSTRGSIGRWAHKCLFLYIHVASYMNNFCQLMRMACPCCRNRPKSSGSAGFKFLVNSCRQRRYSVEVVGRKLELLNLFPTCLLRGQLSEHYSIQFDFMGLMLINHLTAWLYLVCPFESEFSKDFRPITSINVANSSNFSCINWHISSIANLKAFWGFQSKSIPYKPLHRCNIFIRYHSAEAVFLKLLFSFVHETNYADYC